MPTTSKKFESVQEAVQYLSDEVSKLKESNWDTYCDLQAGKYAFQILRGILSQRGLVESTAVSDAINLAASNILTQPLPDDLEPEMRELWDHLHKRIANTLKSYADPEPPRPPDLRVIHGGKSES